MMRALLSGCKSVLFSGMARNRDDRRALATNSVDRSYAMCRNRVSTRSTMGATATVLRRTGSSDSVRGVLSA